VVLMHLCESCSEDQAAAVAQSVVYRAPTPTCGHCKYNTPRVSAMPQTTVVSVMLPHIAAQKMQGVSACFLLECYHLHYIVIAYRSWSI
jgi:hypothetical protein